MIFRRKIRKLTKDQKHKLNEYYDIYLKMALCTEPMNKERTVKAAKQIASLDGLENPIIHYANSPAQFEKIENETNKFSLGRMKNIYGSYYNDFYHMFEGCTSIRMQAFWNMHKTVEYNTTDKLESIIDERLKHNIWYVTGNNLQDIHTVGYLSYCTKELNISFSKEQNLILSKYMNIVDSCFAVRFVGDNIIICDRPKQIIMSNGCVTNVIWRNHENGS